MAFSDILSGLKAALAERHFFNADEAKLLAERDRLAKARICIDDVVAKALEGTRTRASDAIARMLAHHLNEASMAATTPDSIASEKISFDLLALTDDKPHAANASDPKGTPAIFPTGTTPHSGMLTYLLLPVIEQTSEKLVRDSLTDACRGGMRLSDWRKRSAEIDAKLEAIRKQRGELAKGLREAALQVINAPEAVEQGPSAADVAEAAGVYAAGEGIINIGSST